MNIKGLIYKVKFLFLFIVGGILLYFLGTEDNGISKMEGILMVPVGIIFIIHGFVGVFFTDSKKLRDKANYLLLLMAGASFLYFFPSIPTDMGMLGDRLGLYVKIGIAVLGPLFVIYGVIGLFFPHKLPSRYSKTENATKVLATTAGAALLVIIAIIFLTVVAVAISF